MDTADCGHTVYIVGVDLLCITLPGAGRDSFVEFAAGKV